VYQLLDHVESIIRSDLSLYTSLYILYYLYYIYNI
jgi:hypothetical protein